MFTPRTFSEILSDMIAYTASLTEISDYNVGSVIRTILEAAALEDDEQYFQMVQLLDLFSFVTASGEDLDRRLADFGLTRRAAKPSTAKGKFFDNNLIRTRVAVESPAGSTSIVCFDTSSFPTTGYPYTIRLGEGTANLQNLVVSNNDTTLMTFTLSTPVVFDISVGDRAAFVTGGTLASPTSPSSQSRTINIGTQVQAPPTVTEAARLYTTTEPAFIIQGNFESNEVVVKSTTSGTAGNIGTGRINQFAAAPPFVGAGFVNITTARGGLDREKDAEFRVRALNQLQSLSRGTPLAIRSGAIGVTDPATQSTVTSANIVEDFTNNEVFLYIDDGTGSVAQTHILPSDSLSGATLVGATSVTPVDASDWPNSGYIFIETDGVNDAELVQYTSKVAGVLNLASPASNAHNSGSIIDFVDFVSEAAETSQRRFKLTNFPTVRNSERIWKRSPSGLWTLMVRGVDYILNKGTGEFQLTDVGGLFVGSQVIAHYTYYTNLIANVQKVMEGDPDDAVNFPGIKSAGIFLTVEQPIIKRVTIVCTISASPGFVESDLSGLVQSAIESYVLSLKIGEDVIVSKIIDNAFAVNGLADIRVTVPTSNVVVLEQELPSPFDASGSSLVTVL